MLSSGSHRSLIRQATFHAGKWVSVASSDLANEIVGLRKVSNGLT